MDAREPDSHMDAQHDGRRAELVAWSSRRPVDRSIFGTFPSSLRLLVAAFAVSFVAVIVPTIAVASAPLVAIVEVIALLFVGSVSLVARVRRRALVALLCSDAAAREADDLRRRIAAARARLDVETRDVVAAIERDGLELPAPSVAAQLRRLADSAVAIATAFGATITAIALVATGFTASVEQLGPPDAPIAVPVVTVATIVLVGGFVARVALAALEDIAALARTQVLAARDLAEMAEDASGLGPGQPYAGRG